MGKNLAFRSKIQKLTILKEDNMEPLTINWRPEVGKKVEEFFADSSYKEYLESAVSINRKLNEERKMRLPYIDSQTGVAQRHYDNERVKRERMPGLKQGQIYSYPQKHWRKKRYQYLKFFMKPKRSFDPEAEMHTISQIENPSAVPGSSNIPPNEDSNASEKEGREWPYYDEDGFMDDGENEANSDSDFEYEDSWSRSKRTSAGSGRGRGSRGGGRGRGSKDPSKTNFGASGNSGNKRRTHADNIPDSEKPFSCERTPGRSTGRRPGMYQDHPPMGYGGPPPPGGVPMPMTGPISGGPPGPDKKKEVKPSGYCDFCLGDASENKKTGKPEELVSCAECGRSGHPTCLQFTDNMIISVRKYPWQCIECKTCTLCGTSENDDQLLFCDDCDRGYHMYCLVPPIKEPPEGSWSCGLCMERFHKK